MTDGSLLSVHWPGPVGAAAHVGGAMGPEPTWPTSGRCRSRGEGLPGAGAAAVLSPWGPTVWQSLFAPGAPSQPLREGGARGGSQVTACFGGSAAALPLAPGSLGPRSPGWRCSPAGRSEAPAGGRGPEMRARQSQAGPPTPRASP